MKVILDTNVLISAVFRGNIAGDVFNFVAREEQCQWVASQEIVDE